jgi:hypothetical protein
VKNHTQAVCATHLPNTHCNINAGLKLTPTSICVFYYSGGDILTKKLRRMLLSEDGESSYISSFVYILVVVILIVFIINVFHIISIKQEMDQTADQLVKQIQLNGGANGDTDSLFSFLSSQMNDVDGLDYQVSCSGSTSRIQIGTPFYVTVTGRCHLGGFWKFNLVPINIRSQGAGVSEHYWK